MGTYIPKIVLIIYSLLASGIVQMAKWNTVSYYLIAQLRVLGFYFQK